MRQGHRTPSWCSPSSETTTRSEVAPPPRLSMRSAWPWLRSWAPRFDVPRAGRRRSSRRGVRPANRPYYGLARVLYFGFGVRPLATSMPNPQKVIIVFGSSRPGAAEADYEQARKLGHALAVRGFIICIGGIEGPLAGAAPRALDPS